MFFFGKRKELESRVAQLEQELNEAKLNAEQELQSERQKQTELETQVESLNASREALEAEKAQYEETIEALKRQSEEALDEEKARSNDALIALREHIYADKEDLMKRSEKELSVQTLMSLSGFGTRMDRLERRYADLLKAVNTEVSSVIGSESESILDRFRDAKAEMIDAFTTQSEALRSDYGKANEEALSALSSDTQAVVRSFQENTSQMLENLTQKSEAMRTDYGRINDEATQALSANSQAMVNSFQEKTAQMLEDLTRQSNTIHSNYVRINDEATQALYSNSQAVVKNLQQNAAQMTEMVDSLKKEIDQAARDAVEAVTAVPNPYEDSALSAKMNGIEQEISELKARIVKQDDLRDSLAALLDKIETLSGRIEGLYAAREASDGNKKREEETRSDGATAEGVAPDGKINPADSEEPLEAD